MSKFKRAWKAFWKAWKSGDDEQKVECVLEDSSHLRFLAILQKKGRLIDFFKEDIAAYSDAQVGAVVRDIHLQCAQVLEENVAVRPVMEEQEGKQVFIPRDYDAAKIKLVGNVKGDGPYKGFLCHCGWRATKKSLSNSDNKYVDILLPAEVEVR